MDFVEAWAFDRPDLSLVLGPRGGGKSYLSAFATHLDCLRDDRHETKILGGSRSQSAQIYNAMKDFRSTRPGLPSLDIAGVFNRERCTYTTGSVVDFIPASEKSVRGPHVHTLRLDEVDEMDGEIRQAALGMCMSKGGIRASVSMTSTWHRVGGPMAELLERADDGVFPVWRFCVWEVLETCPESRSGPALERCPECPLVKWCHADRDAPHARGLPKAKRSRGHYAIDALIQKVKGVSARVFEADYLCTGPRADGVWFARFDERNVSESAAFDPLSPVHISIDSGVFTGAVLFQVRDTPHGPLISVFADYLAEGVGAGDNATSILALSRERCGVARCRVSTDSSGGSRNPVGPTVLSEYERAGLRGDRGIEMWPKYPGSVQARLNLLETLVRAADGSVGLIVHPRCRRLIDAMRSYARAKRGGQWMDYPEDPQHSAEDLVDALSGAILMLYPDGRRIPPRLGRTSASKFT